MGDLDKIASFQVDHIRMKRGIYVSRKDAVGTDWVTTFDLRMKEPNREPVIDVPALHTIEHFGATWLRSHKDWGSRLIYFGPMGCRTGCYLLFQGDLDSNDVVPVVKECFEFMAGLSVSDAVPGSAAIECGNYLGHDLPMAVWESKRFLNDTLRNLKDENLHYPN